MKIKLSERCGKAAYCTRCTRDCLNGSEACQMDLPEILFRGQNRKTGEKVSMHDKPLPGNWVFGGVLPASGDHSIIYTYDPLEKVSIYTDTLGQYIGKRDKNNTRIFTGDIVRYNGVDYVVAFANCGFVAPGQISRMVMSTPQKALASLVCLAILQKDSLTMKESLMKQTHGWISGATRFTEITAMRFLFWVPLFSSANMGPY